MDDQNDIESADDPILKMTQADALAILNKYKSTIFEQSRVFGADGDDLADIGPDICGPKTELSYRRLQKDIKESSNG